MNKNEDFNLVLSYTHYTVFQGPCHDLNPDLLNHIRI